jgi:glyoxylase-like metal-dependent hydrolase (beta-lactamase superfamily II)/8-oxo-dGTP pyrophosphatase MutT (NUDIX family)
MPFGPGLHVFPGGAVDPADADPRLIARSVRSAAECAAAWVGELEPEAAAACHVAAVREVFEEAGVLLATRLDGSAPPAPDLASARALAEPFAVLVERLGVELRTDCLVPLSRWVTPPRDTPRRYDTRFFVAALPDGAEVVADAGEVAGLEWTTPAAALAAWADRRIDLWPPTSTTLQQLSPAGSLAEVAVFLSPRSAARPPEVTDLGAGLARIRLWGAGAIPGQAVDAYVVGSHRLLVVDPGDPSDAAAEAFLELAAARGGEIAGILLTSAAPDHAAGVTALTNRIDVPVLAGPGTAAGLWGEVTTIGDREPVSLADIAVTVRAVPDGLAGSLAFELPSLGAILTGDLFGDGPSRAIPRPGDDEARRRGEARIAGLGPLVRLSAHGPTSMALPA